MRSVGLIVLAAALAALAGCADKAPESRQETSRYNCAIGGKFYTVGHPWTCIREGGQVMALDGETVPYWMTVEWEGQAAPLHGVLMAPKSGTTGSLTVDLGETVGACEGTFSYTKTQHGVWSVDCDNGVSASGTFFNYGRQYAVTGSGLDSEGHAVDFDALPPR
jgi:hypothetical protein